jgi:hypothetical protein
LFPSRDPKYLEKIAKLHAWPGQATDELYDNLDPEEIDEDTPRTDWLIQPQGIKVNGNRKKKATKGR